MISRIYWLKDYFQTIAHELRCQRDLDCNPSHSVMTGGGQCWASHDGYSQEPGQGAVPDATRPNKYAEHPDVNEDFMRMYIPPPWPNYALVDGAPALLLARPALLTIMLEVKPQERISNSARSLRLKPAHVLQETLCAKVRLYGGPGPRSCSTSFQTLRIESWRHAGVMASNRSAENGQARVQQQHAPVPVPPGTVK